MFLNLESPISSKKLWILLVGNGILSSRSGCCSLFLDWSVVSRPFWRTKNIYFSSTVFNFYCVCVVRTCSHYILSSFPSNFIWPSQGTMHLVVSTHILMVLLSSVWVVWNLLFRCYLRMESWELYSLIFLLVNNCLCSVTLTVRFAKYVILGLHFLSLTLSNMFLCFILEKKYWKLLKTDVIFFCFPCKQLALFASMHKDFSL